MQLRTGPVVSTVLSLKLEEKTPHILLSEFEEVKRRIMKGVQNEAFPEEFCSPALFVAIREGRTLVSRRKT